MALRCFFRPAGSQSAATYTKFIIALAADFATHTRLGIEGREGVDFYGGSWLAIWDICSFSQLLGIIIPTDEHIFQRGRYTTNQTVWIFIIAHPRLGMVTIPPAADGDDWGWFIIVLSTVYFRGPQPVLIDFF